MRGRKRAYLRARSIARRRVSRSTVASNIAEGQGRYTYADKRHFSLIARGSLCEIETQIIISVDLEYLDQPTGDRLLEKTAEVTRLLNGLIRHYEDP